MRWLPLLALVALALLYEPIRADFMQANQACEWRADVSLWIGSFGNVKHVVAYGVLFLAAAITLRGRHLGRAAIGVLVFSALVEFEQSFFVTGHCRAWDLLPNVLGVGLAAGLVALYRRTTLLIS